MLVRVCNEQQQWRVLHPQRVESLSFHQGRTAFDVADALARELHELTGEECAVRVETHDAYVDAVRYG